VQVPEEDEAEEDVDVDMADEQVVALPRAGAVSMGSVCSLCVHRRPPQQCMCVCVCSQGAPSGGTKRRQSQSESGAGPSTKKV
jgi:hypothetical protein